MASVLVVDDERSVRETFSLFLKEQGHDVSSAADAERALTILGERDIDVVVSDIVLPKSSGVDLLESISNAWPTTRVIMITGEPTIETASRAVRAGAHDYLTKPVSAGALQKAVTAAARFKRLRDRNRGLRQELVAAIRDYEQLCYGLADELREPVQSILVSSATITAANVPQLGERGQRELERIRRNAVRLNETIKQFTSLASAGHVKLKPRILDLAILARDIEQELRAEHPSRRVIFELGNDLVASGDPDLLRESLYCLLDNAWKFTAKREQARIRFTVQDENGERVFAISDNGIGFDMERARDLFQAFRTLEAAHKAVGSGTGLAIAQRIFRRHHGRIWAESAPDAGATFYFTLAQFP